MEQADFIKRLVELRMNKGVSARDMSLSIGQSSSYINNIETGVSFPSFFDIGSTNPVKSRELLEATKGLNNEQLDSLISIAKNLKR